MSVILTSENYISIDGTSIPKNSFTVSRIAQGVRINGLLAGIIDIPYQNTTIDGDQPETISDFRNLMNQISFNKVSGSGTTNATAEQFEELNGVFQIKEDWLIDFIQGHSGGGTTALAKPAITLGTATASSIVVNWTNVTNATQYVVKRGTTVIYTGPSLTFTDTDLNASTSYTYTVTASATGYTSRISDPATKSTSASGGSVSPKFIDSGLESGTSTYNSQVFEPDGAYLVSGSNGLYTSGDAIITPNNNAYRGFYQSFRYGTNNWSYLFEGLTNGNYTVHLHLFAFNADSLLDYSINGTLLGDNINVGSEAGALTALIKSYNVVVSNGSITLLLSPQTGQINVAGIEIVAQGTPSKLAA